MDVRPEILELAENANTYTPLGPDDERVVDDRYVLWMGRGDQPSWNVAQRFRFDASELDEVRAEKAGTAGDEDSFHGLPFDNRCRE